jgi:putative flavoprotein involved in K+ transport
VSTSNPGAQAGGWGANNPGRAGSSGERSDERFDVVVVGSGQAGLAIGYYLARQGRRFVILEAADIIGAAWRNRWDSLRLFTPRRYDGLPGLAFPGDPDGYPTRDEVVAYLERYAAAFELPIQLGTPVRSLKVGNGVFVVGLEDGRIEAEQIVVATGPFQVPSVPAISEQLATDVFQIHSTDYQEPGDIPGRRVLVVGGGNTGFQLAKELSTTHSVDLAIGSRQTPLPQKLLGRDIFWWLTKFGLLNKTVESRLGRRAQHRDTLIGSTPRELRRRYGVNLRPRVVSASGRTVTFADGNELSVDSVIWATGYRPDYSWIDIPGLSQSGGPLHCRGVTEVAGLYFLGLSWQHTRGSALLGWVKDDAAFIAAQIAAFSKRRLADEPLIAAEAMVAPQPADATQQGA